ncbi:unnamed protein product, partial [Brenthis ino]
MELSGVIALVLVSFVSGTPHGYGVKGGALAKAEANAASGAFLQPVSLTIPSGAAFTGSFSKSSSSSFASSSSSAHSSSFSFSGSGANGIGGIGCNSNNCKNGLIDGNVPSTVHGSAFNGVQNSGAVASAAAGAIAGYRQAYSSNNGNLCKEANCDGVDTSGNKCSSGKCSSNENLQPQSQSVHPLNKYESGTDCASGQCNLSIQQENAPSGYGSEQQPNNGDSKDTPIVTSSTGQEDDLFVPLSQSSDSAAPSHQKPSVFLNTPNLGPACTSHNCNEASPSSYSNGKLPTSYNVPIFGTYPSGPQAPSAACSSPNCASYPSDSNDVSGPTRHVDTSNPHYGVQYQPGSADVSGQGSKHESNINQNSYSVQPLKPNLAQQNVPTYTGSSGSVDTDQSLGSSKPFLSNLPPNEDSPKHTVGGTTNSINGNVQGSYPSQSITGAPSSSPSYSSQNLHPGYAVGSSQNDAQNTRGYTSNESVKSQQATLDLSKPNTNYLSPSQQQIPNGGYNPTGSNGGNLPSVPLSSKPHTGTFTSPSYPGHTTPLLPNVESGQRGPSNNGGYANVGLPTHAGQFVTPKPGVDISSPLPNLSAPAYTSGFGGPSGSINGNFGHSSLHGSLGTTNLPSSAVSPVKGAPTYTGGFGGPAGTFDASFPVGTKPTSKPGYESNYAETTHTSPDASVNTNLHSVTPKPSTGVSSPYPNPSVPSYNGGFGVPSGSYGGQLGHGSFQGYPGTIKPHLSTISPVKDVPTYTGGFGGPAGAVDTSFPAGTKPTSQPGHEGNYADTTHTSAEAGINTGLHSVTPKPSTSISSLHPNPSVPAYTGGFGGPSGSFVGHGSPQGSLGSSTKPHSSVTLPGKDAPVYTGGFGAPAGPIDKSFPATQVATKPGHNEAPSFTDNLPHQTTHTSYDAGVNSGSNKNSGVHGVVSKPSDSLIPPHHDISNNGLHGFTTAANSPIVPKPNNEESKIPYTGGFGAPSGLLKPNEYNLPEKSPSSALGNIKPLSCTTGACSSKAKTAMTSEKSNVSPHEGSGAVTASASAKAVAYSGGFGGPPGLLKPFDDGKHFKANHVGGPFGRNELSGSNVDSGYNDKVPSVSPNQATAGQAQAGTQVNAGAQAHASAQANAVAFASAGAFGANQGFSGTGCKSGCGSDVNSEGNLANIDSLGDPKTGHNELNHAAGSSAGAKSIAGAGAGSLAAGRSFASAHASAGAAVKGGYGK